jgi:acyl transferase domain-containing protein
VPDAILLEIGPGRTLQTLVRQQPSSGSGHLVLGSVRAAQEPSSDVAFLLTTIAQLWLNGHRVDWQAFSAAETRRRVELPTYPFERQRYWIGPGGASGDAIAAKASDIADWFYVPSWKPAVGTRSTNETAPAGRWLIFCDGLGLGDEMARQLRRDGHAVATVIAAHGFARIDERTFGLSPDAPADYTALLDALGEEARPPQFVLHLWSVAGSSDDDFDDAQRNGISSLTYLAQALEKQRVTGAVQMAWVSNHLQSVLGDEPLSPAKATALGACKVLPQEYPNLRCRAVDVAFDQAPHADAKLAEQLIRELTSEPFEAVVAYRKERRWVQTFEPCAMAPVEAAPRPVRDAGVYLITGGLGNIGLVVAETLARASAGARLALVGRSVFPDREEWDLWLGSEGVDPAIAAKIRRLQTIEALGARVRVFSADAADADQMATVVADIETTYGPINGVVHGAGHTGADGFMPASQVDAAAIERQLRPKVRGLLVLDEILRDKPLDFWVMLSSISGVLGGLNLLPYAAANVFLDAFAVRRNQSGTTPWISIAWDAWQFPADERTFKSSVAEWSDYILPSSGADAFRRVLDRAPAHIVVSATNLHDRLAKWVKLESVHEAPASPSGTSIHQRPNLSSQYVAPRTATEQTVAKAWEQLLGVAPIGIHDKFFELGGHSLLAIQLIAKIRESFQIELPPQRLFESPTVAQFSAGIDADVQAAQEQAAQAEETRITELLDLVEGLSEDQVAEMLANAHGVGEQARG